MDKKKGKGFCKLPTKVQKKISPKNAAACRTGYAGGGSVSTDKAVTISTAKSAKKQPRIQIAGFGKARR